MQNDVLKALRKYAGKTAIQLADEAGTTERRVFAFERGSFKPKQTEAVAIAKIFGVPVEDVFPGGTQP